MTRGPLKYLLMVALLLLVVVGTTRNSQVVAETTELVPELVQAEIVSEAVVHNQDKNTTGVGKYIILLQDRPTATYRGGIEGYESTEAGVDAVLAYAGYLEGVQQAFVADVSAVLGRDVKMLQSMQFGLNGVVIEMEPAEALRVAQMREVSHIEREQIYEITTDVGPTWIGAPFAWDGTATGTPVLGDGIVVAVLDSGVNYDHPSFAETDKYGYTIQNPMGDGVYFGACDPSNVEQYDPNATCNGKLIGAYDSNLESPVLPNGEDENGHGSHTASTAVGNFIDAEVEGPALAEPLMAELSGVAPHANLITYDVCSLNGGQSCSGASIVGAVDGVAFNIQVDGIPIQALNYSISGGIDPYNDTVELGFLNLSDLGVVVAASAGNGGPGPSTLGHQGPWLISTAASTHPRAYENNLIDMAGGSAPADINGAGVTDGYGPAPIVYAGDFSNGDPDPEQCLTPFPPGTWSGEIVVCDRGSIARVAKGQNVLAGGAGGFVLANIDAQGEAIVGDFHYLPGVHIGDSDGDVLRAWLAANPVGSLTATISGYIVTQDPNNGDVMAGFSSRGPNSFLDVMKPNVTNPGVSILAAVADSGDGHPSSAPEFSFLSGTSMSSPHTAGSAALMAEAYPDWSPHEIISALMLGTTIDNVREEDGVTPVDPFDVGAGRVQILNSMQTGLVLDETTADFEAADPGEGGDPRTLNQASFMNSACLQACSWSRTLTNPTDQAISWTASFDLPAGVAGTADPASFTIPAGGTQDIMVTVGVTGAPNGEWQHGRLLLDTDATDISDAHMPISVLPTGGALPEVLDIVTRRDAGSVMTPEIVSLEVTELTIEALGLTPAVVVNESLPVDPTNGDPYDDLSQVYYDIITVPAGSARLVAEIYASDAPDMDLYWGFDTNGNGMPDASEELGSSTTPEFIEYLNLDDPAPGDYWVLIQNWAGSGDPEDAWSASYGYVNGGYLMVDGPTSVPAGEPYQLTVFWNDEAMEAGDKYYGAFTIGTDPANPGNIGRIDIDFDRLEDDVTKEASTDTADQGDTVTFTITVLPNVTDMDLAYTITDAIPAGLTYVDGSASASAGTVEVVDGVLTWTGVQESPATALGSYVFTNSIQDPTCEMPVGSTGGYVDAETEYGFLADPGLSGDTITWRYTTLGQFSEFYGEAIEDRPFFTDDGFTMFTVDGDSGNAPWVNQNMPDSALPNGVAAQYWRDWRIVYDAVTNRGITAVSFSGGVFWLVEYDDVEDWGDSAQRSDFQIGMWRDTQASGPDIFFAYDNVNVVDPIGTVGTESLDGTSASQVAYNSGSPLNDLVLCGDYVGPSLDPVTITFDATVGASACGMTVVNEAIHDTDNPGSMPATAAASIDVECGTTFTYNVEACWDGAPSCEMDTFTASDDPAPGYGGTGEWGSGGTAEWYFNTTSRVLTVSDDGGCYAVWGARVPDSSVITGRMFCLDGSGDSGTFTATLINGMPAFAQE